MNNKRFRRYGVILTGKSYVKADSLLVVDKMFEWGMEQARKGRHVIFYGESGEARSYFWNFLKNLMPFVDHVNCYYKHAFGPVLSVEQDAERHVFIDLLSKKGKAEIFLLDKRSSCHDIGFVSYDGDNICGAMILAEAYHTVFDGQEEDAPRYKTLITYGDVPEMHNTEDFEEFVKLQIILSFIREKEAQYYFAKRITDSGTIKILRRKVLCNLASKLLNDNIDFDNLPTSSIDKYMAKYHLIAA